MLRHGTYLAWSNEDMRPSWLQGIFVGWTSEPDACTDWSNAYSKAPAPPATAPNEANSCTKNNYIQNHYHIALRYVTLSELNQNKQPKICSNTYPFLSSRPCPGRCWQLIDLQGKERNSFKITTILKTDPEFLSQFVNQTQRGTTQLLPCNVKVWIVLHNNKKLFHTENSTKMSMNLPMTIIQIHCQECTFPNILGHIYTGFGISH